VWSRSRLQDILTRGVPALFVCGIARNQDELRDLFDRVFLLRIDERTQEERLAAYDALHPPGRSEAARQEIRQGRPAFEAQMLKAGDPLGRQGPNRRDRQRTARPDHRHRGHRVISLRFTSPTNR